MLSFATGLGSVALLMTAHLYPPETPRTTVVPPAPRQADARMAITDPAGFERRRQGRAGRFLTHGDIETRRASRLSDLFTGIPGMSLVAIPGGGVALASGIGGSVRSTTPLARGGACYADVYLDGGRLTFPGEAQPFNINDIPASIVRGVEIYRSNEIPPQISSRQGCGVVLLWTRAG